MTPLRRSALLVLVVLLAAAPPTAAQEAGLPFEIVPLDDLSAFRDPGANWSVAGGVRVDRRVEGDLRAVDGTGVLVNRPTEAARSDLFTEMEHGDVELELEYLIPRGSNSGLYLMGRYEVQLLDSWGAGPPRYSDAGGIYQRWDPARGAGREGYEGRPPRVNASRAPGLWQSLRILFRAPRFDDAGRKTADARFVRVEHNGVVIHDNVAVTGPTRGSAFAEEAPMGPLRIQGDHGPIAFRNVRVKRYGGEPARLAGLTYRAYTEPTLELTSLAAGAEGPARAISADRAADRDRFGLAYEGEFVAPREGDYFFDLGLGWVDDDPHFQGAVTGAGRLWIGDREVVRHEGRAPHATGTVRLPAGTHPFRLVFFKNRPWNDPRMTLHVEGPGFARVALHDPGALPPAEGVGAITVEADARPVVQRAFLYHGDGKRTHAAAVGDPAGPHYAIDLASGALLYAWRGPFLETTAMWHSRGNEQTAEPLGAIVPLDGAPTLARLDGPAAPWPDAPAAYTFEGYRLDDDGRPTFSYRVGEARVEDALRPAEEGRALHRRLTVTGGDGLVARLAAGASVEPAEGGGFRVDDRYYVEPDPGLAPRIRRSEDGAELVVPVPSGASSTVGYTLVW